MNNQKTFFSGISKRIWTLFLSGLFTILPFILTIALVNFMFRLVIGWLSPIKRLMDSTFLATIPYAEVFLVITAIFFIGFLYNIVILRPIIHLIEDTFLNLPLVKPIYGGIKQLVQAFSLQDKLTFRQVVIIQFPSAGLYSIGFLTSEVPAELSPIKEQQFYNVYIPTTPNPTTGFLIILPKEAIEPINLTRQEAMSLIISGGIIQPQRFSNNEKYTEQS